MIYACGSIVELRKGKAKKANGLLCAFASSSVQPYLFLIIIIIKIHNNLPNFFTFSFSVPPINSFLQSFPSGSSSHTPNHNAYQMAH